MGIVEIGMVVITVVLMLSTTVCGLWIEFSGEEKDPGAIKFHMVIALLTVLSTVITILILI
ncbi:MAG: hypothetical protein ACXADY_24190 [Candidatus Hodarchaeales archaeon]|jgi:hypothetical protein